MPMLLVWLMLGVVGLAACLVVSACCVFCLFRGAQPERKRLVLPAALLAALLLLRYGGAALLEPAQLAWRAGMRTAFGAAIAAAFGWMARRTLRCVDDLLMGVSWTGAAVHLCAALTVLALLVFGGISLLFGTWKDHEWNWEGQRVVVEYSGIFHATGYRYVNGLVHGEQLFEWED